MFRALMPTEFLPRTKRFARSLHRRVNVALAPLSDSREHLARGGIDHLESRALRRLRPRAADEMPERSPMGRDPGERRFVALGSGPVLHTLKNSCDRAGC